MRGRACGHLDLSPRPRRNLPSPPGLPPTQRVRPVAPDYQVAAHCGSNRKSRAHLPAEASCQSGPLFQVRESEARGGDMCKVTRGLGDKGGGRVHRPNPKHPSPTFVQPCTPTSQETALLSAVGPRTDGGRWREPQAAHKARQRDTQCLLRALPPPACLQDRPSEGRAESGPLSRPLNQALGPSISQLSSTFQNKRAESTDMT